MYPHLFPTLLSCEHQKTYADSTLVGYELESRKWRNTMSQDTVCVDEVVIPLDEIGTTVPTGGAIPPILIGSMSNVEMIVLKHKVIRANIPRKTFERTRSTTASQPRGLQVINNLPNVSLRQLFRGLICTEYLLSEVNYDYLPVVAGQPQMAMVNVVFMHQSMVRGQLAPISPLTLEDIHEMMAVPARWCHAFQNPDQTLVFNFVGLANRIRPENQLVVEDTHIRVVELKK